jgi:murein DD-endopeptidase MepM/ murein hydrolase activator NlpD
MLAVIAVAAAGIWFVAGRLEGETPTVTLEIPSPYYIGKSTRLPIRLADAKSGLRHLKAVLVKDGQDIVLADTEFPATGGLAVPGSRSEEVQIAIDPAASKLADGKAILRVAVTDRSWRNWWHGNRCELEKEIVIDTQPPAIEVLTREHYLNQGGAGLLIYRVSEECPVNGVKVGTHFYPGQSGYYPDRGICIAFFALDPAQGPETEIALEATDRAGNLSRNRFSCHIRKKTFKKDKITISDDFIRQILPDFQAFMPPMPGASLKDKFLFINRDLRRMNYETITELTRKTDPVMHWQGEFTRLPNSAPRAGFADHRTYFYAGREIDQQDHLGVDLASLAHADVPAANAGVVTFAGGLGIYGQTVLIDHGFGIASMYSHLSQINVKPGEPVAKDQILGKTGSTGLAGGDHLHFSVLVHDTFVDPIEWWDSHWIKDNITSKLDALKPSS